MPPEAAAAAVATDTAPAPVAVPPAAQPPPDAPVNRSFEERWKAVESTIDDSVDDAPAAPVTEAAKPAEKPAAAPSEREAKFSQLKAIAQELGLSVDDASVSVAERAEFRRAKAQREEAIKAREAEVNKKLADLENQHGEKFKKMQAIFDAYDRGDPESFAQALGAKDFNELQQSWIKRLADPNYMELRRLQKEIDDRKALEAKQAEEAKQRTETEYRQKMEADYMRSLSDQLKASTNPLAAAMHDDPAFLRDIYRIQQENWDDELQKTVSAEEAIKRALKGAPVTLEDWHRKQFDRYVRAFGVAPPAGASTEAVQAAVTSGTPAKNGKKPAPKTSVVPSNSSAGGGAPKKPGDMSPSEWAKHRNARLAAASED